MRINESDLKATAERINKLTGNITESYTKTNAGYNCNIGNYHIDMAYGGYALHQMTNEHGGVRDIFGGHHTKRELYSKMQAYLSGIQEGKS